MTNIYFYYFFYILFILFLFEKGFIFNHFIFIYILLDFLCKNFFKENKIVLE